MKKQINLNIISKQIAKEFEDKGLDPFNEIMETLYGDLFDEYNIIARQNSNKNPFKEYDLMVFIKYLLAQCAKQNIDLNKYFPCFVEI